MRIALDATYSIGDELSGVGLYSREILNGIAKAHPEVHFDFAYRSHRYLRARKTEMPENASRRLLAEPLGPRSAALFHGLNQRLPHFSLRRSVVTFHDLFVMTGEYSTPDFRMRFTEQARDAAARADAIIAVSAFTRQQVVSLLGVAPEKVSIVHHGTRPLAIPSGIAREKIILSVGAIQKRKNIARLAEAFAAVDDSWTLVLAGSSGYEAAEILAQIEQSPAHQRIVLPGYVTPADLAKWYAQASIFAFPSLDEGFGMPLLEAMSAGIPIVTSDRSALPEVAGDAALLVDPTSTDAIAGALRSLTEDLGLRQDLIQRGIARARSFRWEKAIQETWAVYQRVLN
jgi:glycosyltransferase involved in cell wall biosynthesis